MPASLSESTRGLREPDSPNRSGMARTGGSSAGSIEPPRRPSPVLTRERDADRRPGHSREAYLGPHWEVSGSPRRLESSVSIPEPLRSPSHISFGNEVDEDDVPEPYEHKLGLILMRLIIAEEPATENEKRWAPSSGRAFGACMLAPLAAGCLLPVAWTVGVFWAFATIIGDPNSRTGREDEGRPAARAVRRWWENLLLWGVGT